MDRPRLFSTFMLWLLARLYATLLEIGDTAEPVAFFFDEAYLLFDDASDARLEQIELTARLIRSKGVGVFFVTHAPTDVPPPVLSQLGNAGSMRSGRSRPRTRTTCPRPRGRSRSRSTTTWRRRSRRWGSARHSSPCSRPTASRAPRLDPDRATGLADGAGRRRGPGGPRRREPPACEVPRPPDRPSAHEILGERLASADAVAATPPPPKRRERSSSARSTSHGAEAGAPLWVRPFGRHRA